MIDIFRSDNVVARQIATADTSRWVVTFDNYGIGHGFDREGFGQQFLQNEGISAIHVMGRQEDWYQYPEMVEVCRVVAEATRGADRVMTYGSSMGGYAALRFAGPMGAHACLALSPQYTINPARAPQEQRWTQDGNRIEWLETIDGSIRGEFKAVVAYDPSSADRWHVEKISDEIETERAFLPFSGHPAGAFLSETGLLKTLVNMTLHDQYISMFRAYARASRHRSVTYLYELSQRQPESRSSTASWIADLALKNHPLNPMAKVAKGNQLLKTGATSEGIKIIKEALDSRPEDSALLYYYGNSLLVGKRLDDAAGVAYELAERQPGLAHIQGWAGIVLCEAGRWRSGLKHLRTATNLDPKNAAMASLRYQYQKRAAVRAPIAWVDIGWLLRSCRTYVGKRIASLRPLFIR